MQTCATPSKISALKGMKSHYKASFTQETDITLYGNPGHAGAFTE